MAVRIRRLSNSSRFRFGKRAAQRNESFVVKRKRNFYELNGSEEGETRSIIGHLERCRVLAAARAALLMKGEIHRLTCVQPNRKKQMKRKETIAEPHKNDKNTTETVLSFHLAPVDSEGEIEQRGGGVGQVFHTFTKQRCVWPRVVSETVICSRMFNLLEAADCLFSFFLF